MPDALNPGEVFLVGAPLARYIQAYIEQTGHLCPIRFLSTEEHPNGRGKILMLEILPFKEPA